MSDEQYKKYFDKRIAVCVKRCSEAAAQEAHLAGILFEKYGVDWGVLTEDIQRRIRTTICAKDSAPKRDQLIQYVGKELSKGGTQRNVHANLLDYKRVVLETPVTKGQKNQELRVRLVELENENDNLKQENDRLKKCLEAHRVEC